jgi:hypothetical protein
MAILGLDSSVLTLNKTCGQAVLTLAQALDAVNGINDMLSSDERGFTPFTDEDEEVHDPLVDGGMTVDDAAALREAFTKLALVKGLAYGEIAQAGASPSNYFLTAQTLMGTNPL